MILMRAHRWSGLVAACLLAGCGSTLNQDNRIGAGTTATPPAASGAPGPVTIIQQAPGVSGTRDTIVATPSVAGSVTTMIGASRTLAVTFTSSDGLPITGFGISDLVLPEGWSGPAGFACAAVSTGSGCVLVLRYAPVKAGSGTLTLNYIYVNNANQPIAPGGAVQIAYAATVPNNLLASAAPLGQINALGSDPQSVTVTFTTDDGHVATDLVLQSDLTALPAGWSTGAAGFSCAIVTTGSGCELTLTYAPTGASQGTLTLNYGYTDGSGAPRTGSLNIPYARPAHNDVVVSLSPSGQVNAIQKSGGQAVTVTFTTDDGKPVSNLYLTSGTADLPVGWSGAVDNFHCASASIGNGCQLRLQYAPQSLTSGSVTLAYAYTDSAGTAQTGRFSFDYAATTDDNVVATPTPSGQVNAVVGLGVQTVTVDFTTDDGREATALQVGGDLGLLPPGWSASAATFSCAGVTTGNACQLVLSYAPALAASGTLTIPFTYRNNAGVAKAGTLNIPYRATTNDNGVATPTQASIAVRTGTVTPLSISFTTDDGNPASQLRVTAGLGAALPPGWTGPAGAFTCAGFAGGNGCQLALQYAPTADDSGAVTLAFSYLNDAGFARTGTVSIAYTATTNNLYVTNGSGGTLSLCPLNADGTVAPCSPTAAGSSGAAGIALGSAAAFLTTASANSVAECPLGPGGVLGTCVSSSLPFTAPTQILVNPSATVAYVDQATGVLACALDGSGALSGCVPAGATLTAGGGLALSDDGLHAYAIGAGGLNVCLIATDGTLTGCTPSGSGTGAAQRVLGYHGSALYAAAAGGSLITCPVNPDATLGACQSLTVTGGAMIQGLAFNGPAAYLSAGTATLWSCAVASGGALGSCTPFSDPTFGATAGLAVR